MDAVDLPHTDKGPRDALPILLLHGFPLDHTMWAAQARALEAAGARVLVPDLRGHGKAPTGRGPATIGQMAADVVRLADRAGLRRFAVAGFSMGGYVALELARVAPDRVLGLALLDTRAEPDTDEARAGRRTKAERVRKEGVASLAEELLPKMLTLETRAARPELAQGFLATAARAPPEGIAQALLAMGERPDQRPHLAAIRVPTLVVVGDHDEVTPPAAARVLAEGIPGATLVEVPGAHLTPLSSPAAVSDALVAWARGVATGGSKRLT